MLAAAVLCYFLLVVGTLAVVFLPPARGQARAAVLWCHAGARTVAAALSSGTAACRNGLLAIATRSPRDWATRHAGRIAACAAMVALPPLLALLLQDGHGPEGYDHTASRRVNEDVAALLRGEQLVPPTALPPALFATPEVEAVRPRLAEASRQWDLLDADFRQRLLIVFKIMRERHGYEMVLLEGYRSPERQTRLAALGSAVTGAAAWQSYHQYGLAADSAFRRDGKVVIAETDAWAMRGYGLFGSVARSAGLAWGGEWRLKDFGHVELRRPGTLGRPMTGDAGRAIPVAEPGPTPGG